MGDILELKQEYHLTSLKGLEVVGGTGTGVETVRQWVVRFPGVAASPISAGLESFHQFQPSFLITGSTS